LYDLAVRGRLYINAHTAAHPAGEIRGQLTWMADYVFPVILRGQNEIPPIATDAVGLGTFRFTQNLTRLDYQVMPVGLSGPVTAAHIHIGNAATSGPVYQGLNAGEFITGFIDDQLVVDELFYTILDGNAYVNVHTANNPGGEIRGQISIDLPNNGAALLNGDQENPPVTTAATAYGYTALDFPELDSVTYIVVFSGIVPTAAHIHRGAPGTNGTVILPLTLSTLPGVYFGKGPINDQNLTAFLKDELYFNIHSTANPGGEIRGQIENNLVKSFAFDLCGDQEVPAKTLDGYGGGFVTINKSNTELIYGIIADGLSDAPTAAHIHDGAFGANGPVIVGLTPPEPLTVEILAITGTLAAKIEGDDAYINVHTSANPGGEIRGQIRRTLSCQINVGTVQSSIQEISLVSNLINDVLILKAESSENLNTQVYVSDLSGKKLIKWDETNFVSGSNKISFDVNELSSGFYFLNLIDENNSVRSMKFVKQ